MTELRLIDSDTDLLHAAIRENALALEAAAVDLTALVLDGGPDTLIEALAVTVREHCHTGRLLRQYLKAELAGQMVALAASFLKPDREPGFMQDPEFVREQRREHREQVLQDQEDYEYRAPVLDGDDWNGNHE